MQDDESNTNVNEEVVADEPQAPLEQTEPDQEQGVPQEQESVEEEAEAPQEQETVAEEAKEEPAPPSRRETLRIQNLLKKYGPPPERPQTAPSQQGLNYQEALDADPEVIQRLEADRQATGQSQYNEGLKRAEYLNWNTTLKIDAPNVERKYPVLDPNSPEFHPAAADAINQWYLNMSGFDTETQTVNNPNIGYADFVEGFMELVQETAGQKNAQTVKNVAKQAASTGLRPDGSSAKRMDLTKDPSKMTMEELYASIGQKYKK
jgi:hypothetical protein